VIAAVRFSDETRRILREYRPCGPLFPNIIASELFEAAHSLGPFKLLPRTDGGYVVHDTRAPNGKGLVAGPFKTVAEAQAALEKTAAAAGFSKPQKPATP
jgi:hypothetical protein